MIIKWLRDLRQQRLEAEATRADEARKMEQLLIARGTELKEALIKAGIHPFSRINRNLEEEYVFMYGVFYTSIVEATMTAKGAFLIKYLEGGKNEH